MDSGVVIPQHEGWKRVKELIPITSLTIEQLKNVPALV